MLITKEETPKTLAERLIRLHCNMMIRVLRVVAREPGFRGKVNLGRAAGCRGRNAYATRPVDAAIRYGLVMATKSGAAYVHTITDKGIDVLRAIDKVEGTL